jgi:hypothetical protein
LTVVAVKYFKTEGDTNILLYSTNEGLTWKSHKFYPTPIRWVFDEFVKIVFTEFIPCLMSIPSPLILLLENLENLAIVSRTQILKICLHRIFGLITEPGENTTVFTMFGTKAKPGQPIDWIIVKVSVTCPRQEKYLSHSSQNLGNEGHPWQPVKASVASCMTEKMAL